MNVKITRMPRLEPDVIDVLLPAAEDTRTTYYKVCKECGKEFETHSKSAIFCSPACGQKYRRNRKKQNEQSEEKQDVVKVRSELTPHEVTCVICGRTFFSKAGSAKYCSRSCMLKGRAEVSRRYSQTCGEKYIFTPKEELAKMDLCESKHPCRWKRIEQGMHYSLYQCRECGEIRKVSY